MTKAVIKTPREQLLDFDPNNPVQKQWATYSPIRRTQFTSHNTRQGALSCLAMNPDLVVLYRLDDATGKWEQVAIKDKESHKCICEHCGGTTIEHVPSMRYTPWSHRKLDERKYGSYRFDTGQFVWERTGGRKLAEPLRLVFACIACRSFLQ